MKGERHKHYHFDLDVNATESTETDGLASATGIEINIPHQTSRSFQHDDDDDDFETGLKNAARELQKLQMAAQRGQRQPETVQEAYYNDGATELFLALEDTEWRRALQLIENDPDQVYCWIVSMGSLDTTTNWSIWRRLPLHEACRRQAPAWLISALLSVYPGAAQESTQFGELPLHLAVECGSPPEVVNLLVVAHWHGILKTDQSGRTPRAILQDSEMLDLEDHKVVYESLLRSEDTYQTILQQHEQQVNTLQQRHASGILAMEQDHAADLKRQAEKYSKLQEQLKRSQMLLRASELSDTHNVEKLQEQDRQAAIWQERVANLQEELSQQISEKEEEQETVRHLQQVLQQKNEHIEQLQNQVATLQGDLQSVVAWNDQVLQKKVQQTETKLQLFVREFLQLRDLQGERGEDVKDLLTMRGIPIPVPPPPPKKKKEKEDEKKMEDDPNLDDDVVDQDAMDQAAAAACSALDFK